MMHSLIENVAPPAGFNVMTASNALLTELGLPPRPTTAAALKDWLSQVTPFSNFDINGSDTFCTTAMAAQPLVADGHDGHTFWGGYELRSGPYEKAVGHFQEPTVTADSNAAMFNWIGLWGLGTSAQLVQAGTENEPGVAVGHPFWELYCTDGSDCIGAETNNDITVSQGTDVSVSVSFNPATDTSYYAVTIPVNGKSTEVVNVMHPMENNNSGTTADFITERVANSRTTFYNLPNFGSITYSNSRTYTVWNSDTSVSFGSQNYHAYEMTSDGNFYSPPCSNNSGILLYPNDVSDGGFVNNFCRANG